MILAAAIASKFEVDVRKWAYTNDSITESGLIKELKATNATRYRFPQNRESGTTSARPFHQIDKRNFTDRKRPYSGPQNEAVKHFKPDESPGTSSKPKHPQSKTGKRYCFSCKKDNHDWAHCFNNPSRLNQNTKPPTERIERRVNICTINPQG